MYGSIDIRCKLGLSTMKFEVWCFPLPVAAYQAGVGLGYAYRCISPSPAADFVLVHLCILAPIRW